MDQFMTSLSQHMDRVAVTLSGVCLLHCLLLPVIIVAFPALTLGFGVEQHFHGLMLWLVVPISVVGLYLGFRRHGRSLVIAVGAVAIAVLIAASTWAHDHLAEVHEVLLVVLGSLMLAGAHVLNFQWVRGCGRARSGA